MIHVLKMEAGTRSATTVCSAGMDLDLASFKILPQKPRVQHQVSYFAGSIQHSCDCKHWNNGSSIQHSCCIQSHFHLASIRIWNVHSNDHSSLRWHCNDWQTYLWGALLRFDSAKLEWTQKYLSALHMLTGHHVGLVISCVRCFNTAVVGMLLSESSCSYNSKWSAFDEQSATCNNWDFENMHSSSYSGDATLC